MPNIVMSQLSKQYTSGGPWAVDDLDLEVTDGELLCLLGPSGCGKTTTLRMLAGLEDVTAGRITAGETVWDDVAAGTYLPADKRRLGLVFQSYALWPHMDVQANIDYPLRFTKTSGREAVQRRNNVMATLGIADYSRRHPSELSGGQQQRVALARALVAQPEILLLDEPLSNLDARLRLEMRSELARLHRQLQSTMILVTHDQWEAMTLADRIAIMDRGKLVQLDTPAQLYLQPVNRFVAEFIGNPPIQTFAMSPTQEDTASTGDGLLSQALSYWSMRVFGGETIAHVGIRPEMVRFRRRDEVAAGSSMPPASGGVTIADDSSLTLPGVVHEVVPTGGSWLAEIDMGGQFLPSLSTSRPTAGPGDEVDLHIPAEGIYAFDSDENTVMVS